MPRARRSIRRPTIRPAAPNLVTKMGIDATRKSNYPDEIAVPGFESIDMAAFIPGYRGA